MAPPRLPVEQSISYTPEYKDFIEKLTLFHEKRGTPFDPEPKVGPKQLDLFQLFTTVVERGGYDKLSDTKLAWRQLGEDIGLPLPNIAALAFTLKSTFYKYLAAYEITTVHGKEPPPREILEDLTAKGGGLLTRTLENFRSPMKTQVGSEASGDDDAAPAGERNASEETPGSGGRGTRGLRQAPPQRVLFQPETQPSRQSRHVSATSHPPNSQPHINNNQPQPARGASSYNQPSNIEHQSAAVANYEPRPQMPLTLRPIITPGNNPNEFARRQKILRDAQTSGNGRAQQNKGIMFPGTGFDGPNIYVRCLCALKSGIPSEQDYALHHLVKISMERGDKYKFESFPGLAEALIEKVLEVSSLFYLVDWKISYMDDGSVLAPDVLNGLDGTPDILERIKTLTQIDVDDNIQPADFVDKMLQINEAALTIRNMVMLEENAQYASDLAPLRDFLSIALNLPALTCVIELKHYALEIAEQITKYIHLEQNDPLYTSLLAQLNSQDRGAILTALRAIIRISMNLEETNLLRGVPKGIVENIIGWTLLFDEDLVHACLDFLYQYTAVVSNIEFLVANVDLEPLVVHLTRLLSYGVKTVEKEYSTTREFKKPAPQTIAPLPQELLQDLLKLSEPDRSSLWLRCLFEEDREESITQIALWQSYQSQFNPLVVQQSGVPILAAADFIKNVSTTFADKAAAQVQAGPVQKFIIKGIRRRAVPVGPRGDEFTGCQWKHPASTLPCGKLFISPIEMYRHILRDHLSAVQKDDGTFDNTRVGSYNCQWEDCRRFRDAPATKLSQIASHIRVHLPPQKSSSKVLPDYSGPAPAKKVKLSYIIPSKKQVYKYQYTAQDEHGQAAGVPLTAVLILRNLARNLPKTEAEDTALKTTGLSHVVRLFKPVEPKLYEIFAQNKPLVQNMTDLLTAIRDAEA